MRQAWADSVAAGIPDELFWDLTLPETEDLLVELAGRDRALRRERNMRAGVIAATIVNTTPRRSRRIFEWTDFFPEYEAEFSYTDTPEGLRAALLAWAEQTDGVTLQ